MERWPTPFILIKKLKYHSASKRKSRYKLTLGINAGKTTVFFVAVETPPWLHRTLFIFCRSLRSSCICALRLASRELVLHLSITFLFRCNTLHCPLHLVSTIFFRSAAPQTAFFDFWGQPASQVDFSNPFVLPLPRLFFDVRCRTSAKIRPATTLQHVFSHV